MSYHLYKARANEVIKDSHKIENLEKRVLYLIKAKGAFTSEYTGHEVGLITSIYDNAIEETKFRLMQLQNKASADIQASLQGESFKDEAYIEENKDKAIEETVSYFVKKHEITPDRNELRKMLSNENDYIKTQLKHNSGLIKRGRKNELINELESYITRNEKLINKIKHNEGGCTTNSNPIKFVDEFCQLVFYYIFHTEQIIKINNPEATGNPIPPQETTEQKIKRILEPLRGAFDTTGHIDKIVKALAEYADSNTLPGLVETKIIQVNNPDFYPYFKKVKNETRLTVPGIALVLKFFICKNNGTGGDLETSTIEKNIKLNYKIVPE